VPTITWQTRFAELVAGDHAASGDPVDAGAQLLVLADDGTEVFLRALARHYRIERAQHVIWVRPLVGGFEHVDLGYVFNLGVARRRPLNWTKGALKDNGDVVLHLRSGEVALVQPAVGPQLDELQRWDRFTDRLTRVEEAELDRLASDSWGGRFS
jgi:hypothetical protein